MARNIIICCDGTGKEVEKDQSNVLKLYRMLDRDGQVLFYDPGVGTISDSNSWGQRRAKLGGVFGMMTGQGMDENLLQAYRFLIRNWQPGDQVYLFGFSRGAYTVRALAGMLYLIGLLSPDQENMVDYALRAYKKSGYQDTDPKKLDRRNNLKFGWQVRDNLESRYVPIRFVGCWDTVKSVIVPGGGLLKFRMLTLPYTMTNPAVQTFRHALAIDERRRLFRVNDYKQNQVTQRDWDHDRSEAPPQDIQQTWFTGVHSDVGGGYDEDESGASKFPLIWMIDAAREAGLKFREDIVESIAHGTSDKYAKPDPNGMLHNSLLGLGGLWKILEWLPKRAFRREWHTRTEVLGFYLPRAEPRVIPEDHLIHPSVWDRTHNAPNGSPYQPENLPDHRRPS